MWLTGWQYRKKITIDSTKVDADLTDFPVLVKLTSANFNFSKARSDGFDIRFTASDGTTLLKYERERHDATNQLAEYWVKIPSVSGTVDTDFYIYYGNSSATDGADPANVWDSNFKAVWHLKESSSPYYDSTANGCNSIGGTYPAQIDGMIGKAQDFEKDNSQYINFGNPTALQITSSITLEAWIKIESFSSGWARVISKLTDSPYNGYELIVSNSDNKVYFQMANDGTLGKVVSDIVPSTGVWYYYACTYDGETAKIYRDGGNLCTANWGSEIGASSADFNIGRWSGTSSEYFDGIIDEIRVSNVPRSAAWIKASYHSGNNTILSYGVEESLLNTSLLRRRLLIR